MPLSSIIALSAIVAAFLLFAVVLAWADRQTRDLPRETGQSQSKPGKAAAAKVTTQETKARHREAAFH